MHLQFKENWVKVVSNDPTEIQNLSDAITEGVPEQVGSHFPMRLEESMAEDGTALSMDVEAGDWPSLANAMELAEYTELRDELNEAITASSS